MLSKIPAIYAVAPGLVSFVLTCLSAWFLPKSSEPESRDWGWLVGRACDTAGALFSLLFGIIALLTLVIAWFINHEVAYGFVVGDAVIGVVIWLARERD